jgi:undecaprenyl-diphosphatase
MTVFDSLRHRVERANQTQPASRIALRHLVLGIALSVIFTVIFARLLDFVKDSGTDVTPFDRSILFWMYHHRNRYLTAAAAFLAHLGSPPVIAGIAVMAALVGLFWHKVRGAAWTLPIAIIGAGIIIQGVKLVIHRPRPSFFAPLLHESGFSFPSGHSLIAMVVYGLLGYFTLHLFQNVWARLIVRVVTVLLVVAIGVSRVYVGVHFPTDVLAGWTAGVPWLIACLGLHEVFARRWPSSGEPVLTSRADASGDTHSTPGVAKTFLRG